MKGLAYIPTKKDKIELNMFLDSENKEVQSQLSSNKFLK